MIYKYIVNIGDSLTTGARDQMGVNFGFYLSEKLTEESKTTWYCIQRAETKFTIEDIRRRIFDYCRSTEGADIATILIGSNNAKGNGTPSQLFKCSYKQIIDVCLMHGKYPILCTLPLIEFGSMPEHFRPEVGNHISRYNGIIKDLAREYMVQLCRLDKCIDGSHLIDGIHFNNSGNYVVSEALFKTIMGEKDESTKNEPTKKWPRE